MFCFSCTIGNRAIAVAKVVKTLDIPVRVGGLCNMSCDFNRCAVLIALAVARTLTITLDCIDRNNRARWFQR